MDILIRRTDESSTGEGATLERAIETDTLSIGSALDQDLRIADVGVAGRHATIALSGEVVQLTCRRDCSVLAGGEAVRRTTLSIGDELRVGDHRLSVVAPPTGFDLALEVAREGVASIPPASFPSTQLSDTWLAPRIIAWSLSIAVLAFFLAAPLAHHYLEPSESSSTLADMDAGVAADTAIADAATDPPDGAPTWHRILSDAVWSSGPLHESHSAMEDDCGACHETLFKRVTDGACERCHLLTQDHVSDRVVAANAHLSLPMGARCGSCHKEHNSPSTLIDSDSDVCTDCHESSALSDGQETLATVTAFGTDTHPGFSVTLPKAPTQPHGEWTYEQVPLAGARESSGLRFNHEVHADGEKMGRLDGNGLACAECHRALSDGEHFASISFEVNCATSGCHQLELDDDHRIPHAMPGVAVAAIEGYYLREFADPEADQVVSAPERRRRPDRRSSPTDRIDCGDVSNYDCALRLAERKIEQQFNRTGCVTCHFVERADNVTNERSARSRVPFELAPVRLTADYHPAARFDHGSHGVLIEPESGRTITGDASCIHCHDADASTSSEDLMMPAIDNCTACHDGLSRTANVPLGCVDCHDYHPASLDVSTGKES